MSFPSPSELLEVLVPAVTFFAFIFSVDWFVDCKKHAPLNELPRPDQHIPPRERQLLGDDYRDLVAPYFGKVSRRRRIVRKITGADHV